MALLGRMAAAQTETVQQPPTEAAADTSIAPDRSSAPTRPSGPSGKVVRYAQRIVAAHDANGDGQLQSSEWERIQGQPQAIDADGNGIIITSELVNHIVRFAARRRIRLVSPELATVFDEGPLLQPRSAPATGTPAEGAAAEPGAVRTSPDDSVAADGDSPAVEVDAAKETPAKAVGRRRDTKFFVPAARLPAGLPAWFQTRDSDGDGQITLAEYAPTVTATALAEFERYDRDRDGVITAAEYAPRAKTPAKPKPSAPAGESTPAP